MTCHSGTSTTFSFANLSVSAPDSRGLVTVGLDVTNTGSRSGAEVVQVYVADPASAGEPPKQLRGFAKVNLTAGQTKHVSITLDAHAFQTWSTQASAWTTVPGQYGILAGDSSRNLPLTGSITV